MREEEELKVQFEWKRALPESSETTAAPDVTCLRWAADMLRETNGSRVDEVVLSGSAGSFLGAVGPCCDDWITKRADLGTAAKLRSWE